MVIRKWGGQVKVDKWMPMTSSPFCARAIGMKSRIYPSITQNDGILNPFLDIIKLWDGIGQGR